MRLLGCFVCGAVLFCVYVGVLCGYGMSSRVFEADVAVVFGNKAYADGRCSQRLAARLNKSIELYKQGMCGQIIVSGGIDKVKVNEALVMRDYLLARGIPQGAVVVDEKGINSRATAEFVAEYMYCNNKKSALVVTQYYHIARAQLALYQEGVPKVGYASPYFFEKRDVYSILRECVGFLAYLARLR